MRTAIGILVVVIALAIVGPQAFFTVDETQFALVTRFGDIRQVHTSPGLKAKVPFVDSVTVLDNRLLRTDVPPATIPDREQQFLVVDAYTRWRITNARRFREALLNERNADSRISAIVRAELREEIGKRTRPEIIGAVSSIGPEGLPVVDPVTTEEGVPIREALTQLVRDRADERVRSADLGIEIVDVRMKRADFPEATEASVFNRMRTEREVQAKKLRAEGEEEFREIKAEVDRAVAVIRAEANEQSARLRGEGQAEAIRILAEALEKDPELFEFLRTLESYQKVLNDRSTLVLSPDSELFKFLQSPDPASGESSE